MKVSNLIIGAVAVSISFFIMQGNFIDLDIQKNGQWVKVEIIDKPNSCIGTKVKWFMKIKYKDKIISKQISSGFCEEHNIGDIIKVKYLNGIDNVLLPEDNIITEFISTAIIGLVGLYVIFLGWKKPPVRSL